MMIDYEGKKHRYYLSQVGVTVSPTIQYGNISFGKEPNQG